MAAEPYKVNVTLKHPKVVVSEVHLAPGHETPVHAHEHGYVVHPRAATKLLKTTYKNGAKVSEEVIDHTPGQPYFVAKSEDGITFSMKNIGTGPMACEKTFIRDN